MAPEFETLLAAAREGDEASFVALFRATQPALLRYLSTMGGAMAEDVAGDTWLSVVRGMHRFSGDEAGWRSWVFTIAHARLRDAQRRAARQPATVAADEQLERVQAPDDVAARVEAIYSTEAALALVGRLPREQAEVVLLRHVAGLDVASTARVLGKSPGNVRVAAHRGLRRLAQLLDADPALSTRGAVTDRRA
jgi:RNA polymerase sigma-70 factor (ECF subfamily)